MFNIRLAFRTLFRTPFVTSVAVVSLALGIGANAAIFSLFNDMILRALPVPNPQELVNLGAPGPKPGSQSTNQAGETDAVFSYPMFRDLEQAQTVFTGIAAHRLVGVNIAYRGQTSNAEGMLVSGSYFGVLGLTPAVGRLIDGSDDRAGGSNVVVLSHRFWRDRFDASPAVLNETLVVNGRPMTIVGVAPPRFESTTLGAVPNVFLPLTMAHVMMPGMSRPDLSMYDNRRQYFLYLFARLKPGVSIEQARAALQPAYSAIINTVEMPLQKGLSEQTLARFKAKEIAIDPGPKGQSAASSEAFAPLTMLLGVTGLVLLTACANIANLLLARATRRSGEMALRLAIGASRRHLITQLLVESLLLAAMGGLAGLLVARWTLQLIGALLPADAAAMVRFELDPMLLLFLAAVSIGTGLMFGLFPAVHSSRPNLLSTLKSVSGQPAGARSAKWFRTSLATAQIVLSMALLAVAGLFTKSLINISRVDLGLDAENVITFGISPILNGYSPERSRQLFLRIEEEIGRQPGVATASAALVPVLAGNNWSTNVSVQGFDAGPDTDSNSRFNEVGPGYFKTLGVPLIAGREFTAADVFTAPKVAIVNEQFARKFNLGRDVVGKRMEVGASGKLDIEIVGLVKDAKYSEVKAAVPPLFFTPYQQDNRLGFINFYVRTAMPPESVMAAIPALVSRIDPNLPVENLRTLPQQVRENVFIDRLVTTLSTAFAALATILAAVGLYGVLAYTIAQRTREIGLRMALGAEPARVRRMVLKQVGWMTIIGGAFGLGLAMLAGHYAQSLLFELNRWDPVVLTGAAVTLTLVALAAGYVPALRASRVDPMRALRYE